MFKFNLGDLVDVRNDPEDRHLWCGPVRIAGRYYSERVGGSHHIITYTTANKTSFHIEESNIRLHGQGQVLTTAYVWLCEDPHLRISKEDPNEWQTGDDVRFVQVQLSPQMIAALLRDQEEWDAVQDIISKLKVG